MRIEKKLYCHWDLVRFVREDHLIKEGKGLTLSLVDENKKELLIFLEKDDSNSCFEVRVYKAKPTDKYIPHASDNVERYEENDEYATFIFDEFESAKEFVDTLSYRHKEYCKRPCKKN